MPRLLIDGTALGAELKGVGRYSHQLIDQLTRRLPPDWVIEVMIGEFAPTFTGTNVPRFHRVSWHAELTKGVIAIPWMVWRRKVDVVLVPMDSVTLAIRRPIISVLHDISDLVERASRETVPLGRRLIDAIKKRLRLHTLRRSHIVICNSQFTAAEAVRRYHIDPVRIRIGYCGIDERFYVSDDSRASDWWPSIDAWDGYVLTFATGDRREAFNLCPPVWELVHRAMSGIGLIVAGIHSGERYTDELREDFARRGVKEGRDFLFVPFITDDGFAKLRALYRDADFYLELSRHEGFGMQLAEAMAVGTTCIASSAGALHEIAGGYAVEFVSFDPAHVAATIVQSYQRRLHLRGNAEQERYTRRFNWHAVGQTVADELLTLNHGRRDLKSILSHPSR